MAYDDLERSLLALGIAPLSGASTPVTDEIWQAIEEDAGGEFPPAVRWWFARFGGARFPEGDVVYSDPRDGDVTAPLFLDGSELRDAYDDTREVLPADVVPFSDDGAGNRLCVGIGDDNRGRVFFHVHDAPLDRAVHLVDDDFEHFLRSLHRDA